MPRCLLNFHHYDGQWTCSFLQADARSTIGRHTKRFNFATEPELRAFVLRCNPEDIDEFDNRIRRWGQGSTWVNLTNEQYAKLDR